MPFKLTKAQVSQINELAGKIREEQSKIDILVSDLNHAIAELVAKDLVPSIEGYNKLCEEAQDYVSNIGATLRGEYDAKSEKWQEGDAGQEADTFISQFEDVSLSEIDLPEVDDIVIDFEADAETLEDLTSDS